MALSQQERTDLLAAFEGLRVADVRDGMDTFMLHFKGSMSPEIRPVFRTRAVGIAKTVRYVPYVGSIPAMNPEQYWEWVGWYYQNVCPYPFLDDVQPGDFCVIDQSGVDAGLMGSHNTLIGLKAGARGYVSSGGVRDTDELIIQKVPFWSRWISQTMVQGRLQYDSKDIPVSVGGVLVHPGDVVVADGDGVVIVPRKQAFDVAKWARREQRRDMAERRKLYGELGLEEDATVKE